MVIGGKKKPLKQAKKAEKHLDDHDVAHKKAMKEQEKQLKEARAKMMGKKK